MALVTIYDLLEVDEKASKEEIEKAYLRLANEYRVDPKLSQLENDDNEIIIKKLKLAYDILSDDEKRSRYDADLAKKRAEELIKNVEVQKEVVKDETAEVVEEKETEGKIEQENVNVDVKEDVNDNDEEPEIQLTNEEKKKLQKAAKKEFKENLKKAQKADEEYNRAYNEAYNNYLRKMGYTVKEPWTWKRVRNLIIGILVLVLICALIWFLPPTRKLLIQIYEENFVVKSLVDIVAMLFNAIKNAFK